jgi:hypothetical protein
VKDSKESYETLLREAKENTRKGIAAENLRKVNRKENVVMTPWRVCEGVCNVFHATATTTRKIFTCVRFQNVVISTQKSSYSRKNDWRSAFRKGILYVKNVPRAAVERAKFDTFLSSIGVYRLYLTNQRPLSSDIQPSSPKDADRSRSALNRRSSQAHATSSCISRYA